MRVLWRWQLPILTVADRGGARLFRRLPNRKGATVERAMNPLVPGDSVLCSDGGNGYKNLVAAHGLEHFVIGRAILMTWMPLPTASTKTA